MTITRKTLCIFYGIIGLGALITTQIHAFHYLPFGAIDGNIFFWKDTFANHATRFITIDILFLALAVTTWMLMEANRLQIKGAWIYVIIGTLIGISFAIPVFLIHREIKMSKSGKQAIAGRLSTVDFICLLFTMIFAIVYTYNTYG